MSHVGDTGLEKMMDDLAGRACDSGQEEDQRKKDPRNVPLKARAKQKRNGGSNGQGEDNQTRDGAENIIEEASKAIMQNHFIVTIEESKEILYYDNGVYVMAYTFHRDNPFEIINILFGYGANGKSVFTGLLSALHGIKNISNVPLSAIIKNNFALSDLEYKDVNIDTELSSATIHDTAILKKLTGRQPVRIERKNQRGYDTVLHAKLFFSVLQICGTCYGRVVWKKRIPVGVRCDNCKNDETLLSKYGEPRWVKNGDAYLCWSCFVTRKNTGQIFSPQRRKNISNGIRRALEAGVNMGPKIYAIDETVFDTITQESAYWIGELLADGYVYTGKVGNPRIALTVAEKDREHLVKFRGFLKTTYGILLKISRVNGRPFNQYSLRITSKRLARRLITLGVTPNKSLTAKVIGLQDDKHFWRGVLDGDGYIKNRDGIDGDKIIVVGSYDLMKQFECFIKLKIPDAVVKIKQDGNLHRLFVYGYTARMLAKTLYSDCSIALERKLTKALKMVSYIQ